MEQAAQNQQVAAPIKTILRISGTLFFVNVVQAAETLSDPDDRVSNPKGTYLVFAETRDEALDAFHAQIAIGCLDDFDVTCMRITPGGGYG